MGGMQKERVNAAVKSLTVLVGLMALSLFGTAFIAVGTSGQDKADEGAIFAVIFIPGDAGSMDKNESSGSSKSFFLSIPAVIGVQNLDCKRPDLKIIALNTPPNGDVSRFGHLTTTASISSRKALEFTLVGAKPSGTS